MLAARLRKCCMDPDWLWRVVIQSPDEPRLTSKFPLFTKFAILANCTNEFLVAISPPFV